MGRVIWVFIIIAALAALFLGIGLDYWDARRRKKQKTSNTLHFSNHQNIMNEKLKSLIRHILTAIGFVLGLIGLGKYTGLTEVLLQNLDGLDAAISTVVGIALSVWAFFTGKDRFVERG